jgi:hypothetical protein
MLLTATMMQLKNMKIPGTATIGPLRSHCLFAVGQAALRRPKLS